MQRNSNNTSRDLPPGFRFHPTDEELIVYYLRNQATSKPCPVSIIPEVDIYKFDPWQLPDKAEVGENEWYFFTPRDRKYPNGARPNRAAVSGYWKATGTDKAIYSGSKYVGVKKALVFYTGRPPKGTKTDWIMHEYRLNESRRQPNKQNGSMRLDDWVLCRIYKKRQPVRQLEERIEDVTTETKPGTIIPTNYIVPISGSDDDEQQQQNMKFPRTCSLTHLLQFEYMGPISQLLGDANINICDPPNNFNIGINSRGDEKFQFGELPIFHQHTDSVKYQVMNQASSGMSFLSQPLLVNPLMYEFQ